MWRLKGGVRNGKEFDTRHVSELVSVLREELELSRESSRAFFWRLTVSISPLDSADDSLLSSIRRVRKK
jgi:hypothetical protein